MAKRKRWTSSGRLVVAVGDGAAVQAALLPNPAEALTAAGWQWSLGGDDAGRVWGHASRRGNGPGTGDWITAHDTSAAGVLERLWRAAQEAD